MMLGLAFLVMTAVAVLAVLLPLGRRRAGAEGGEEAVYRDQLTEIERDSARGTIGPAEAEAARVEVARRLIAASERARPPISGPVFGTAAPGTGMSKFRRRAVAVFALAGLPLAAAGLYSVLGRPDLPDRPLTERAAEPGRDTALIELVARVEAELAKRPDDGQGWDVLAPVYLRSGQAEKAAAAYANAIRLLGSTAEREAGHGEALTLLAQGKVTPGARAAFARATALDPKQIRSRFYLGRASEQDGDLPKAAAIYRLLLTEASPDAPYIRTVREALAAAALGEEGQAPAVDPAALENVSPDQRLATIRGMVEGLDARLKEAPRDLGGQLRLVRAWTMLGEPDRAKAAADAAKTAFADDPEALRRIADLLLGLGLEDKPA
jgi:cytochrome c-type biogenesis protein CcmH